MRSCLVLTLLFLLSGCATTLSESYEAAPPITSTPAIDNLYIVKAVEGRPQKGKSKLLPGLWIFLPLVPYGHQQWTPERYYKNHFFRSHDFLDEVTDTVVNDLAASGVARNVVAIERRDLLPVLGPEDAVFRLRLEEGMWHRKITAYGLSVYGAYAWLVAPISFGHLDLGIAAQLEDSEGQILAEGRFDGTEKVTEWLYVNDTLRKRLPSAYGQISPGLRQLALAPCEPAAASPAPLQQATFEVPVGGK